LHSGGVVRRLARRVRDFPGRRFLNEQRRLEVIADVATRAGDPIAGEPYG